MEQSEGDSLFLIDPPREYTYSDLRKRIDHFCSKVSRDCFVLCLSENCFDFCALYLACLKEGKTFVPLPSEISQEKLTYIHAECPGRIFKKEGEGLVEVENSKEMGTYGSRLPSLILYTSGSTADPKGVCLTDENLRANTQAILDYLPIHCGSRQLVVLPFFYSFGLSLLNTHLKRGAALILNKSFFRPQSVVEDLLRHRCTSFSGVPSTYIHLVKRSRILATALPDLSYFTQAGGRLSPEIVSEIADAHPQTDFFVMYGCTEATARVSYLPPKRLKEKLGSVGVPIPGMEIDLRGTEGELWIRGASTMQGYWKDAKLTDQYLQEGWLFTGDLAQKDSDGFLYITGRKKEFIKSAGYRVATAEIETFLLTHPRVLEAVVKGVVKENGEEEIVAYYSGDKGTELQLRQFCLEHLPFYKCPSKFIHLGEIPKLPSGKVARNLVHEYAS